MTLSDQMILHSLCHGLVIRDPHPQVIQPASVDLHLGRELLLITSSMIDPGKATTDLKTERFLMEGGWILNPGKFILGHTQEWVEIPRHLVGILTGKSSLARIGLQVEAAGYIDPGWKGRLTVELFNMGPAMLVLRPGMPIGQLRVCRLEGDVMHPYGSGPVESHYQHSAGVVPARFGLGHPGQFLMGQDEALVGDEVPRVVVPVLDEHRPTNHG